MKPNPMPHCHHCGSAYHPHKSSSALRLTYCGIMCELSDLGTTIEAIETWRHPEQRDVIDMAADIAQLRNEAWASALS